MSSDLEEYIHGTGIFYLTVMILFLFLATCGVLSQWPNMNGARGKMMARCISGVVLALTILAVIIYGPRVVGMIAYPHLFTGG